MHHNRWIWFFYYLTALTFLFMVDVQAYVDPSVLTYAIQVIAGIAIALGTFIGLYVRKLLSILCNSEQTELLDPKKDDLVFNDPKTGQIGHDL